MVFALHGDEPQGEHGPGPVAGGLGPSIGGVVGGATGGQVDHDETQPAQPALQDSPASAIDGANDDARGLGGGRVVAVGFGDQE